MLLCYRSCYTSGAAMGPARHPTCVPCCVNCAQARQYITGYGRAPASTVGSVVLTDLGSGRSWEGVDVATVSWVGCLYAK